LTGTGLFVEVFLTSKGDDGLRFLLASFPSIAVELEDDSRLLLLNYSWSESMSLYSSYFEFFF
jgi:hypothetical protein